MRRDLHLIRKIRNDFGHVASPIDFTQPAIASRCNELYYDPYDKDAAPRHKFTRTVMGVLAVLHARLYTTDSRPECSDTVIDDERKERFNKSLQAIIEGFDAEQIVGRERRGRVSQDDWSGDA